MEAVDVARLALAAGLSPAAATTAVAIAKAESGFNERAHNRVPPDDSVGLWQINYIGAMRAPRTAAFGSPEQLKANPAGQARAMHSVSAGGTNWRPWSVWWIKAPTKANPAGVGPGQGPYRAHLPLAARAVAEAQGGGRAPGRAPTSAPVADGGSFVDNGNMPSFSDPDGDGESGGVLAGVLDPLDAVGDLLGKITDPAFWRRVGIFAAGGALVAVGAGIVFKDTILGAAATAVTGGAVDAVRGVTE